MALEAGRKLGLYEILDPIGAYRARSTVPETRSSVATLRSKSCPKPSPKTKNV
jgi:hypothetical protein